MDDDGEKRVNKRKSLALVARCRNRKRVKSDWMKKE